MRRVGRLLALGFVTLSALSIAPVNSSTAGAYSSGTFGLDSARAGVIGVGSGATRFVCAVTENGYVKCWGDNYFGHLGLGDTTLRGDDAGEMGDNLPYVDLGTGRRVRNLSVGGTMICATLDNGRVKCWGQNLAGQLGYGDTAIRGDGAGEMGDNLPYVNLGTGRTVVQLSSGSGHSCAILDNWRMKCWGFGSDGELGYGDTNNRGDGAGEMGDNLPYVDLGTGRTAIAVSTGYRHTCAILDNGRVKCWGGNFNGELGYGDSYFNDGPVARRGDDPNEMGDNLPYVDLGAGRTAIAIAAGEMSTCAILDNGGVKCWGENSSGRLGLGDTDSRGDTAGEMGDNLPYVDLGTGRTAVQVSLGTKQTCVVLDNGSAKCWGENQFGQLGLDSTNDRGDGAGEMGDNLPAINLGTGRTARSISTGFEATCASLDDQTVKCWGRNGAGELGNGTKESVIGDAARGVAAGNMAALPVVDLGSTFEITAIEAGYFTRCALFAGGRVKCWGNNSWGQSGLGDIEDRGDDPGEMGTNLPFIDLGTGRTATSIAVGRRHVCAVLDNGRVKCWGYSGYGILGLTDTANDLGDGPGEMGDNLPYVDLGTGRTAVSVSAGQFHTCAVLDNGTVKCWGHNVSGQLGLGDTDDRGDGAGEMGDNLPAVSLGANAVAVSAGTETTCALLVNGAVKCWGYNAYGQLGLGDTVTRGDGAGEMGDNLPAVSLGANAVAVSAGTETTCALLVDGVVKCWGRNNLGQLGNEGTSPIGGGAGEMGANLAAVNLGAGRTARAVRTGYYRTCAVLDDYSVKCWGNGAYGSLGQGDTVSRGGNAGEMAALQPVNLGGTGRAFSLTIGSTGVCAQLSNGLVKCWGGSSSGELGNGDITSRGDNAGEMGSNLAYVELDARARVLAPTGRPLAPTTLTANASTTNVALSWLAPSNNGGSSIIGYRIDRSTDGASWTTVSASTGTTATSALVSPLSPGTNYQFRVYALNSNGVGLPSNTTSATTLSLPTPPVVGLVTLTPARIVDTRPTGKIGNLTGTATDLTFNVHGKGGLPNSGISAVVLNVTAVDTETGNEGGYLTVYPCAAGLPDASNLNFTNNQIIPNTVIAPVDPNGNICFHSYGKTHVLADVSGYFPTGSSLTTLTPARIVDTRPTGKIGNLTGTATDLTFNVHGKGGLPNSGISAVVLNVTAVDTETGNEGGYLTVYPCAAGLPDASNLNFTNNQIIPNTVIAPVDPNGNICFHSYGKTHVLADVSGYFPTGSSLTTLTPARIVDTRPTGKIGNLTGTATDLTFNVHGKGGLPNSGISAVVLNVTAVDTETGNEGGYLTVYPCAAGLPDASNLNFTNNQIIPNTVIAPVDPNGNICFHSYGKTHVLADVSGYFPTSAT